MEKVKNAVILAAGIGLRCVPLTYETPKALLKVHGTPIIERIIKQLHEKGIKEIIVVVGYKKEQFNYLKSYNVRLIYNPEYYYKNTLSSLYYVLKHLGNSYIIVADNYFNENIFNRYEPYTWAGCAYAEGPTHEWCVTLQENRIHAVTIGGNDSYYMVGPAYFTAGFSEIFKKYIVEYYNRTGTEDYYWENVLKENLDSLPVFINDLTGNVQDMDDLETLRAFDSCYKGDANNFMLKTITSALNIHGDLITGIEPVKHGMTNYSFRFSVKEKRYIYRVPGEGTDKLINRKQEYAVYKVISPLGIGDNPIYFDPETGHKITGFLEDTKTCNPFNSAQVKKCMKALRNFHNKKLEVNHTFDLFEQIDFYESLWKGYKPFFDDYYTTKAGILKIKNFIDICEKNRTLCHIDSAPVNFLLVGPEEEVVLIDWEYAGMQDAHSDIATFAVNAGYNCVQIDDLINNYFLEGCSDKIRLKIYCYIAVVGFLWFNWCEYKRHLTGVEHGLYALNMYNYAKDYYQTFEQKSSYEVWE